MENLAGTDGATELRARDAAGDDLRHFLAWTSHHGRHERLLKDADQWLELNPDATAVDLFGYLENADVRLDERTMHRAAKWIWGEHIGGYVAPPLRPGQFVAYTVPRREIRQGFPPGAHLKGGRASAPVLAELAREFYEPIIPIVMELRRQGLSLRAIARELEQRGIKPRYDYPPSRWSAAQVQRVLLRGSQQAAAPASSKQAAPAQPKVAAPVPLADIKFLVNGTVYGSYTEEQVLGLLDRRRVTPETQATRTGMAGWRPLKEVIELRGT